MSSKKVGLIGNTNNNNSVLQRYLIDLGVDAELVLLANEDSIFNPWIDGCSEHKYSHKIRRVSWGSKDNWFKEDSSEVLEGLSQYDVLIGTDQSAAYCSRIGKRLDVFFPHGGDLSVMPFKHMSRPSRQLQVLDIAGHQKNGIKSSRKIHLGDRREFTKELRSLGKYDNEIHEALPPLVHWKSFNADDNGTLMHKRFREIRNNCDILITSPIRHVWGLHLNPLNLKADKSNDKMIRAIASLRKKQPWLRLSVILFEYGLSVKKSKRLIRELGLEDIFKWFPCVPRSQLFYSIRLSDLVIGELGGSFLSSSSIQESLISGVPFLGMREDRLYGNYKNLYNMLNACEEPVDSLLQMFIDNVEGFKVAATSNKAWFVENCIRSSLELYCELADVELPDDYNWCTTNQT